MAFAALSQILTSWPARRKARESDARVFGSSSTISSLAFWGTRFSLQGHRCFVGRVNLLHFFHIAWQLDRKGGSRTRLTLNRNFAAMVAHDGLHNCQSK